MVAHGLQIGASMQHPTRTIITTDYYRSKATEGDRYPRPVWATSDRPWTKMLYKFIEPDGTTWVARRFSSEGFGDWEYVSGLVAL